MKKAVIAFFLGVGIALAATLPYLGLAALLVSPVGLAIVIGSGFFGALMRYAIPPLTRWAVQKIVESNIKSSLQDNDPEKKLLKRWLHLSAYGNEQDQQAIWRFQFKDGRSLTQYALDQSTHKLLEHRHRGRRADLHASQSLIKGLLFTVYEAKKVPPIYPASRWYHRLLLWIIRSAQPPFTLNADLPTEENVFPAIKDNIRAHDDFPAVPHLQLEPQGFPQGIPPSVMPASEPPPSRLLNKPARIEGRLFSKNAFFSAQPRPEQESGLQGLQEDHHIPSHLQHWIGTLSLSQQVGQHYQHQHVHAHKKQKTVNLSQQELLNPAVNIDIQSLRLRTITFTNSAANKWVEAYKRALADFIENPEGRLFKPNPLDIGDYTNFPSFHEQIEKNDFYISKAALRCLKESGDRLDIRGEIDLNTLPLGFNIIKSKGQIILHFDEALRNKQLATDRSALLLTDPFAEQLIRHQSAASDTYADLEKVSHESFLNTLESQHIILQPVHQAFIAGLMDELDYADQCVNETLHLSNVSMKNLALLALQKIAEKSSDTSSDHFLALLDKLMALESIRVSCNWRTSRWGGYAGPLKKDNLLHYFIRYYLIWVQTGAELNRPIHLAQMQRLSMLSPQEIELFRVYSKEYAYNDNHRPPQFEDIAGGLFCFFDFLTANQLKLQPQSFFSSSHESGYLPLSQLKQIWDCLTLTPLKKLQWQYQHEMPETLAVAKAQLQQGYSFVHKAMSFDLTVNWLGHDLSRHHFEQKFKELSNPFMITPEEFEQIHYVFEGKYDHKHYRALYLRFIALNVHPEHVEKAIAFFERKTGTRLSEALDNLDIMGTPYEQSEKLKAGISRNWEVLRDYALSLPSKLQMEVEEIKAEVDIVDLEKLTLQKKQYEQGDVDVLLKRLNLDPVYEEEIRGSLGKINTLAEQYHQMSAQEMKSRLGHARELSLIECIALLRETLKRLGDAKKGNGKGEWLRPEQLVVILMALKTDSLNQVETSEGKTLILQIIAILKALRGEKVDIIPHNKVMVSEGIDERLMMLASFLKLKVTKKSMGNEDKQEIPDNTEAEIQAADIHYTDISTAVMSDMLSRLNEEKMPDEKQISYNDMRPRVALVDEVDNIVIDIHANTTMQVSEPVMNMPDVEPFLLCLTHIIREELAFQTDMNDTLDQFNFVKNRLDECIFDNPFYQTFFDSENASENPLSFWIKAAVTAMSLRKQEDYVIDPQNNIRIMHKKTTGERDEESQWSNGIHQCVAAFEKLTNPDIYIPPISQVIAESNAVSYLRNRYTSRCGFSGTLGEDNISEKISYLLQTDTTLVMPRAKRPVPPSAEWRWPLTVSDGSNHPFVQYSRAFRFPPIHAGNSEAHFRKIAEAIAGAQENQQSCIIFFNTIAECNDFSRFLENRLIIPVNQLQIFDYSPTADNSASLRPPVRVLIKKASEKGMVTLTTAAGSRGIDFEKIDIGIIAKPGLKRVTDQKSGRIGRNGAPGQVYEIYCDEDLERDDSPEPVTDFNFRRKIEFFEQKAQEKDLRLIDERQSRIQKPK